MPSTDNIVEVPVVPSKAQALYETAKGLMGQHLTLDPSVDKSVGCAECISYVLKEAGYAIPKYGIAGTALLTDWLEKNFKEVPSYEVGAVIVAATGTGSGKIRGHAGICAIHGILSNESQSGLFKEQWDEVSWRSYYDRYGGFKSRFFVPV